MSGFNFDILSLLPGLISIFLCTFMISLRITKMFMGSFWIAIIKAFLFLLYFKFMTVRYTFVDDDTYIDVATQMYNDGLRIYNVFSYAINSWQEFLVYFGGTHFMYQIYNLLSFQLFGPYYFSPVVLNIILTSLIGVKLYKITLLMSQNEKLAIFTFVFFVLHWDTISWSNYLNLKDFLVQFLTINIIGVILQSYTKTIISKRKGFINVVLSVFVLLFLRYYIPVFILFSVIVFHVLYKLSPQKRKSYLLGLIPIIVFVVVRFILPSLTIELSMFQEGYTNPIVGFPRYLLTPLPFNVAEGGEFQTLASFLHWLFIPIFIIGLFYSIKNQSIYVRFIVVYLVILSLFYGSFLELQGPRHRIQIHFILIYFQALGLFEVGNKIINKETVYNK